MNDVIATEKHDKSNTSYRVERKAQDEKERANMVSHAFNDNDCDDEPPPPRRTT